MCLEHALQARLDGVVMTMVVTGRVRVASSSFVSQNSRK